MYTRASQVVSSCDVSFDAGWLRTFSAVASVSSDFLRNDSNMTAYSIANSVGTLSTRMGTHDGREGNKARRAMCAGRAHGAGGTTSLDNAAATRARLTRNRFTMNIAPKTTTEM